MSPLWKDLLNEGDEILAAPNSQYLSYGCGVAFVVGLGVLSVGGREAAFEAGGGGEKRR